MIIKNYKPSEALENVKDFINNTTDITFEKSDEYKILKKFIEEYEPKNELVVSDETKLSKQEIGEIIIKYLNEKTGKRFRPVASNLKFINGRLDEGYTIDDLKYVIDIKVADNKAGRFENLYLRPETLFNATKFQSYVNQELTTNGKKEVESRW